MCSEGPRRNCRGPIEPNLLDSWIRCGRQQQPDAFDTLARGANRAGIDVVSGAEKINTPQDVVRPARRQADADLVRPGVGQPVADVWTAIVIRKRMPRFEHEHYSSRFRDLSR